VLDATGVTASVGLGPLLGPHVAFAGGAAAAAYLGRKGTFDTAFRYHQAKQIAKPLGSRPDVLAVGAAFGALGVVVAGLAVEVGLPADPVFLAVVVSGFVHRLGFGYPLLGRLDGGLLDMRPHENDERWGERETAQGVEGRQVVEPWQPDHYEPAHVAALGAAVGLASGYLAVVTGSVFLAFGLSAATLAFLALGLYAVPVTYHMALPASVAALAVPGAEPAVAIAVGGVFGLVAALVGELAGRVLYAHGDTHVDPAAVAIVVASLLVALLVAVGVFEGGPVPYPVP